MQPFKVEIDKDALIDHIVLEWNEHDIVDFVSSLADKASWYYEMREQIINRLKDDM